MTTHSHDVQIWLMLKEWSGAVLKLDWNEHGMIEPSKMLSCFCIAFPYTLIITRFFRCNRH